MHQASSPSRRSGVPIHALSGSTAEIVATSSTPMSATHRAVIEPGIATARSTSTPSTTPGRHRDDGPSQRAGGHETGRVDAHHCSEDERAERPPERVVGSAPRRAGRRGGREHLEVADHPQVRPWWRRPLTVREVCTLPTVAPPRPMPDAHRGFAPRAGRRRHRERARHRARTRRRARRASSRLSVIVVSNALVPVRNRQSPRRMSTPVASRR